MPAQFKDMRVLDECPHLKGRGTERAGIDKQLEMKNEVL